MVKIINEEYAGDIRLVFSKDSTIPDNLREELLDLTWNGIMISPNEGVPIGWDSSIEIKNGYVIMEGNLAPGGPSDGRGGCIIKVPVDSVDKYYNIYVEPIHEHREEVTKLLKDHNLL